MNKSINLSSPLSMLRCRTNKTTNKHNLSTKTKSHLPDSKDDMICIYCKESCHSGQSESARYLLIAFLMKLNVSCLWYLVSMLRCCTKTTQKNQIIIMPKIKQKAPEFIWQLQKTFIS
uniref:Uncharacterized protein n=1 Tax=Rhizophora mucronata TaxID=61149 RepID=A0A2P2ISE0_RHIMU